jgi:hypothetical protein
MKSANAEEQILAKYERNVRKNEDALLSVRKKQEVLDKQEDELYIAKVQLNRYFEEQREIYAGTEEFARYYKLDNDIHEITTIAKNQLDKEREALEKEGKLLYAQQEIYYEECQSELKDYYSKEDN